MYSSSILNVKKNIQVAQQQICFLFLHWWIPTGICSKINTHNYCNELEITTWCEERNIWQMIKRSF